jgi:hypothetical protein
MEFPDSTLRQVLLGSRDVMALREVGDDLLADPSPLENSGLGIGKTPFQIRDHSVVGGLLAQIVWVLEVDLLVRAA